MVWTGHIASADVGQNIFMGLGNSDAPVLLNLRSGETCDILHRPQWLRNPTTSNGEPLQLFPSSFSSKSKPLFNSSSTRGAHGKLTRMSELNSRALSSVTLAAAELQEIFFSSADDFQLPDAWILAVYCAFASFVGFARAMGWGKQCWVGSLPSGYWSEMT